jgi:peptidoglycan/LPS O-acetylase OafA/YrhL
MDEVGRRNYLPKLDGLRAASIGLVLLDHFLSNRLGTGGTGVTIFFVLSGYLITSILIEYSDTMSLGTAAATFFWHRILRLSPAYYLCIAVTALLGLGGMRATWWINALYLSNFKIALDGTFGGAGHFWSLSVEEQFYILWFFVVVAIPRRFLLPIILLSMVSTLAFRWGPYFCGANKLIYVLLPGSMGSLATGALIAYVLKYHPQSALFGGFVKARTYLFFVSAFVIAASIYFDKEVIWHITYPFSPLMAACLVTVSVENTRDWKTDWLANPIATHIGKISYGIFVYHYFVPEVIDRYTHLSWLHSYTAALLLRFALRCAVSLAIAEISWRFMEQPILKLKKRTPFLNAKASPPPRFLQPVHPVGDGSTLGPSDLRSEPTRPEQFGA